MGYASEGSAIRRKLWSGGDPSKHVEEPLVLAHGAPQRHLISLNNLDVKIFISLKHPIP